MLKDHGNPVGRPCTDRFAVDEKPAAAEIGEARDAAQKRGLAAARGAHDAHDLVALDRKRQLMEGHDGTIEKELAGGVPHRAAAAASSLGKKSAERNARLRTAAPACGERSLMAWRRSAGAPGP